MINPKSPEDMRVVGHPEECKHPTTDDLKDA